MFFKRIFLFFIFFSFLALSANDKLIFCITSDRSASMLNQGALEYLKKSNDKVTIRTVSQITNMSNEELQNTASKSDVILYAAVFGDIVDRLLNIKYNSNQIIVSLQGDRRLLNLNQNISTKDFKDIPKELLDKENVSNSYLEYLKIKQENFKEYSKYLQARAYWDNRGSENISNLLEFLSINNDDKLTWPDIYELKQIRYFLNANAAKTYDSLDELKSSLNLDKEIIFILDNDRADIEAWKIHEEISKKSNIQIISILSSWGEASGKAIENLENFIKSLDKKDIAIISLHDFVIGGSESRVDVLKSLEKINIPVVKGLKVLDLSKLSYDLSSAGLPINSVHYRISMPELQGIGQVHFLAMNDYVKIDKQTGVAIFSLKIIDDEIDAIIKKAKRWITLKTKENKDKKIAIVYYNHPPGRHNIGADNLNVPETLFEMLKELKKQGYEVGTLPKDSKELLSMLQDRAVNLPNDKKALKEFSTKVPKLTSKEYEEYFKTLPNTIQNEMKNGPLDALHTQIESFLLEDKSDLNPTLKIEVYEAIENYMDKTMGNLHHALDGIRNQGRQRAINLLDQLKSEYLYILEMAKNDKEYSLEKSRDLKNAIIDMKIEGIRGWGETPGIVMTYENEILIPSVTFGNVILAPQPPRGWELNEELLHANLSFPPTHQYLGFYHYLKDIFKTDAIVHVGRHSTYEFLPRKSVGVSSNDYSLLVIEDIPSIYPYIVDGVGEGIQAKRRGHAIMIDHLTPPLAITKLYDNLLELRQLIESAEAAVDDTIRKNAIKKLKESIEKMNLRDELINSMDEELKIRGIGFDEVDDEFLLHEVGHYLTHLQEEFMPLGLHTFGKDWETKAVDTMIESMNQDGKISSNVKQDLINSPSFEMKSFINALNGGFITSGKGNDPIRTNEALPTGRNFYALDGSLIPTTVGYNIGVELANKARVNKKDFLKKEAVILWASDTVRDEGAMIAFGLDLLGIKPIWNSRGILKGIERLPLDETRKNRIDIVFNGSGLFRDLYATQLVLLNKAVLLSLDASSNTIIEKYPALGLALNSALKPIEDIKKGGNEPLEVNAVATNWVNEARELLKQNPNINQERLGQIVSQRVFATAPGAYGAGINRMAERSNSWNDRKELADVFIKRMAYSYGLDGEAQLSVDSFKKQLSEVENTYLGRASNLYGLIDNNDTFDYLGGLNLAIESLTNNQPNSYVINHSNSSNLKIDSLQNALLGELRGRFFNPQWIKPLMNEGYSGARTMGNEFIEYLWGWQITSPEIIKDWVWQEVKAVYIDDKLNLGLDEFLSSDYQVHVQTNMLAVMLVAIEKKFWNTDEKTINELSNKFTENIIKYGIPGSGHTHANHPIYEFVKKYISQDKIAQLQKVLDESRIDNVQEQKNIKTISEIKIEDLKKQKEVQTKENKEENSKKEQDNYFVYLLLAALFILSFGFFKSLIFNKQKGI